ncbi:uncharacterized protein A4U43_C04F3360 [Asparagus officinalis]|uniref:Pectinesterase catalytic domain-containing protein n=1 Tax=Asparagus officinalis TaxID=4686 RepID=A0A5P1EXW3_ASPOF|nr:uncharacterized protein A4U43_C04F3360 [Asparagus officinalis]
MPSQPKAEKVKSRLHAFRCKTVPSCSGTSFVPATAISGQGFIAQDICFKNTAGASKGQAVALRVDVGFVAFYRCANDEYQFTLYARRGQQSYRECNILCTVDFIFGDASAVFQNCMIYAKLPMQGQDNAITAQGRESEIKATCFSM